YVSDFYNKIIGHYEVDLKHPGRDKDRGRVWRIVWKGKGEPGALATGGPTMPRADWTSVPDKELVHDLVAPNLTVRMIAGQQLLSRVREGKKPDFGEEFFRLAREDTVSLLAGWGLFFEEAGAEPVPAGRYRDTVKGAKEYLKPPLKPDQYSTLV